MRLTDGTVAPYQGGQMEIQNVGEGYLYRGEIATIEVRNGRLHVTFAWVVKGEGGPPIPDRWVKDDHRDYVADLDIYAVSNIGPSEEDGVDKGGDRLLLQSDISGEMVVLYPPDGSKFDPSQIEGF